MDGSVILPGITTVLALLFSGALIDQWRQRRRGYQLIWGLGMLFFAIGSGAETLAVLGGWNEVLYRSWYLTGAVWTAGWLGLGTCFLLGRTRFGYAVALCLFLAGLFTFLAARRLPEPAGDMPMIYFIAAGVLAAAVAIETYFQNERWPQLAAVAVIGATAASVVLMLTTTLPAPGYAIDPQTGIPTAELMPPALRLLTPFMNVTGGLALMLGAAFSAYVFMPKRRVLGYSLEVEQPGDAFLFNLLIAPVAITVNFVASLPQAVAALFRGRLNSRVPATLLIALGALVASSADTLARLGSTEFMQVGRLVGVVLLLTGFLISVEVFREIRIPFTRRVLRADRTDHSQPAAIERRAAEQRG